MQGFGCKVSRKWKHEPTEQNKQMQHKSFQEPLRETPNPKPLTALTQYPTPDTLNPKASKP